MEDADAESDLDPDIHHSCEFSVSHPAGGVMRRDDLMQADLVSEVILVGSCLVILLGLIMFLATVLSYTPQL